MIAQEMELDFNKHKLSPTGKKRRTILEESQWDRMIITYINLPYNCSMDEFVRPYGVTKTPFARRLKAYKQGRRKLTVKNELAPTQDSRVDLPQKNDCGVEVTFNGATIKFLNGHSDKQIVNFIKMLNT